MNLMSRMLRKGSIFKKLAMSERGNVLILMGLSMPLLVGLAGLGTDTIQWTLMKQQLQRSADSAALNGAFAKAQAANASVNANLDLNRTLTAFSGVGVTVQNAPTTGAYAGNVRAVRVALTYKKDLPFSSLFLATAPTISVESTAAVLNNGDYCVISLENSTSTGVTFSGNSSVNLKCGVATNSVGNQAVVAAGSTTVVASPVVAVGVIPASNNFQTGTKLISRSMPQRDPFAHLADPTSSIPNPCNGGNVNIGPNTSQTINPGCYSSINVKGNLTMRPGIYYIKGGNFSTSSQSNITAIGVTIILTGDGTSIGKVDMNGGAKIEMSATTSGIYQGVLFYKDRDASPTYNDVLNGGASGSFLGAIYMPSQTVTFTGNPTFTTDCLQLVARNVVLTGKSSITNKCPPTGTAKDNFTGIQVRLVG